MDKEKAKNSFFDYLDKKEKMREQFDPQLKETMFEQFVELFSRVDNESSVSKQLQAVCEHKHKIGTLDISDCGKYLLFRARGSLVGFLPLFKVDLDTFIDALKEAKNILEKSQDPFLK